MSSPVSARSSALSSRSSSPSPRSSTYISEHSYTHTPSGEDDCKVNPPPAASSQDKPRSPNPNPESLNHTTQDYAKLCKPKLVSYFFEHSQRLSSQEKNTIIKIALDIQKKLNQACLTNKDKQEYEANLSLLPDSCQASELIQNLIDAATHKNFYNCYHDTKINWFGFTNTTRTISLITQLLQSNLEDIFKTKNSFTKSLFSSLTSDFEQADVERKIFLLDHYKDNIKKIIVDKKCLQNTFSLAFQPNSAKYNIELAEKTLEFGAIDSSTLHETLDLLIPQCKKLRLEDRLISKRSRLNRPVFTKNAIQSLVVVLNALQKSDLNNESNIKLVFRLLGILNNFSNLPNELAEQMTKSLTSFWEQATEVEEGKPKNSELGLQICKAVCLLYPFKSPHSEESTFFIFIKKVTSFFVKEIDLEKEDNIKFISGVLKILNNFSDLPNKLANDMIGNLTDLRIWATKFQNGEYENVTIGSMIYGLHIKFESQVNLYDKLFEMFKNEITHKPKKDCSLLEKIIQHEKFPSQMRLELFEKCMEVNEKGDLAYAELAISIIKSLEGKTLENKAIGGIPLDKLRGAFKDAVKVIGITEEGMSGEKKYQLGGNGPLANALVQLDRPHNKNTVTVLPINLIMDALNILAVPGKDGEFLSSETALGKSMKEVYKNELATINGGTKLVD